MADTVTAQGRRARGEDVYCPFVQPELSLKEQCVSLGVRVQRDIVTAWCPCHPPHPEVLGGRGEQGDKSILAS